MSEENKEVEAPKDVVETKAVVAAKSSKAKSKAKSSKAKPKPKPKKKSAKKIVTKKKKATKSPPKKKINKKVKSKKSVKKKITKKVGKKVKKVIKKKKVSKAVPMISFKAENQLQKLVDTKAKRFTKANRSKLLRFAVIAFNPSKAQLAKLAGSKLAA